MAWNRVGLLSSQQSGPLAQALPPATWTTRPGDMVVLIAAWSGWGQYTLADPSYSPAYQDTPPRDAPASGITDNLGGGWLVGQEGRNGNGMSVGVYYKAAARAGVLSVSTAAASIPAGYANSADVTFYLLELSEAAGSSLALDATAVATGVGGQAGAVTAAVGPVTPIGLNDGDAAISVVGHADDRTTTIAAPWAVQAAPPDITRVTGAYADILGVGPSALSAPWSLGAVRAGGLAGNVVGQWIGVLATIRVVPPVRLDAFLGDSRKVVFFGAAATAPDPGAGYRLMQVTGVAADPTAKVNGKPAALGSRIYYPGDAWPLVAYPVRCGAVDAIAIEDGGEGIVGATVAWVPGSGGGTSLVLGPVEIETGICGYTVDRPGSGFADIPAITPDPPPGYRCTNNTSSGVDQVPDPGSPIRARATAAIANGQLSSVVPACGGARGCGTSYRGTTPGATVSGGGGINAHVIPRVSTYIARVPVVSSSDDFTSPPSFAITYTGGTPGRGAALLPMMSGPAAGDTLTYSAPPGWLTATVAGSSTLPVAAATDVPVGAEGSSPAFAVLTAAPTMPAGCNLAEACLSGEANTIPCLNLMFAARPWTSVAGVPYAADAAGNPDSWSPGVVLQRRINWSSPFGWGTYTVVYGDRRANTPGAAAVLLGGDQRPVPSNIQPVNLSGPHAGTATGEPIADADIGWDGQGVTGLGFAHSPNVTSGAGYQAAIVVFRGSGGEAVVAFATVVVQGGKVTTPTLIAGGSYSSKPTAAVYGVALDGTEVRQQWLVSAPSTTAQRPDPWLFAMEPANNDGNADGTARWTLDNDEWCVAPMPDGSAVPPASIGRPDRTAYHPAVFDALSAGDTSVAYLRVMDSMYPNGYGGDSNGVQPACLPDAGGAWQEDDSTTAPIVAVRRANTDPSKGPAGDKTYHWASTKVYGPQDWFPATNLDPPFTITGTTVAGSDQVTGIGNITSPLGGLMAGSTISGPGIPAGSAIYTIPGATTITLGGPRGKALATASGTDVTFTVQDPPHILLPAADDGMLANHRGGSSTGGVAELRSAVPHGITTGQAGVTSSSGVPIAWTNCANSGPRQFNGCCWVTGPFTWFMQTYVGDLGDTAADRDTPQFVAGATEYDTSASGMALTIHRPISGALVLPIEFATRLARDLPRCTLWLSLSAVGTAALHREFGRRAYLGLGPNRRVIAEYWNEIWAGGEFQPLLPQGVLNLLSYLPAGTTVLNGHYTADGTKPPDGAFSFGPLAAAAAQDAFVAGWVSAGGDASDVKRPAGGFWAGGSSGAGYTAELYRTATRHNLTSAFDYVLAAPYLHTPWDDSVAAAFAPAGSMAGAQSLAIDGIVDVVRHIIAYRLDWQRFYSANRSACDGLWETINYEGAIERALPDGTPFQNHLTLDFWSAPAARKAVHAWLAAQQAGDQSVANTGSAGSAYYQAFNLSQISFVGADEPISWSLAEGFRQPPGDGLGTAYSGASSYAWPNGPNRFLTVQGGPDWVTSDPNVTANLGVATPIQGLRDWFGATPAPTPTPTPTPPPRRRRWFSGLGRGALRPGR